MIEYLNVLEKKTFQEKISYQSCCLFFSKYHFSKKLNIQTTGVTHHSTNKNNKKIKNNNIKLKNKMTANSKQNSNLSKQTSRQSWKLVTSKSELWLYYPVRPSNNGSPHRWPKRLETWTTSNTLTLKGKNNMKYGSLLRRKEL